MPQLDELQTQFLGYLSGKNDRLKGSVVDQGNISVQTRLDIYKNAYQIRLKLALETDHEMLGIYLGDTLFDQMVDGYIHQHPSHCTSLRDFGESLPEYLKITEPFKQHPIIAEIARFERWLMDVFDAADADRLLFSDIQEISPQKWPALRFRFHPSLQLFNTEWNCVESWKALKNTSEPPPATQQADKHWLLWRSTELLSEFRPLEEDEYRFLSLAVSGETFAALCESILEWHDELDVSALSIEFLSRWFEQGIVIAIETDA
ncbi:MAG: putative DNA-binding domain-containing protein [Gammaproteobacteria bacterium]